MSSTEQALTAINGRTHKEFLVETASGLQIAEVSHDQVRRGAGKGFVQPASPSEEVHELLFSTRGLSRYEEVGAAKARSFCGRVLRRA